MKTIRLSLFVFVVLLALALTNCMTGEVPAAQQPASPQETAGAGDAPSGQVEAAAGRRETQAPEEQATASTAGTGTPEDVAVTFFQAYTEASRNLQPTLEDPGFDAKKVLSDDYLKQVAEIQAGFEGFGFDPVLQAQIVPPGPVEVKETLVDGDQATVVLQFGRDVLEQPWERTVSLERIDGQWQIVPDRVEGGGLSPQDTVQAFYDWYLGYIGSGEQFHNPLAGKAYREAPYLAGEMVQKVDRMAEAGGFSYDPFLCAQEIPSDIKPLASFYNDARPVVVMSSSFPGSTMVADLARDNFNSWTIRNLACGSEPAGLVKAFYTWTLDYFTHDGEMRNPWVEGAHRESGFLSQSFIQELDRLVGSGEPLPADPVLLAQDLPLAFNTQACPEENCALVNLQYGDWLIRQLRVELVEEGGRLQIAGVSHPEGPESPQPAQEVAGVENWVPYVDEQYGYAVRVPSGWEVETSRVTDLHTPEDYPVMRSARFYPPGEGGERIPFQVEVMVGDEQAVSTSYPITDLIEETEINGYPLKVYRSDPGLVYYIFRGRSAEEVWVIFTDPYTQFPGREAQAAELEGVFEALLSTVAFSR